MDPKLDKAIRIAINNAFYNQKGKMRIYQSDIDVITFFKSIGYKDKLIDIDFIGELAVYDNQWDSFYTFKLEPVVYDTHLQYARAPNNSNYKVIYTQKSQIYTTLEDAKKQMANQIQYRQNLRTTPYL